MPHEDTSAAVASILSNFAKQYTPLSEHAFPDNALRNGFSQPQITLPGEDTVAKQTLERELTSLATRIQLLEAKANSGTSSLPMTPNEPLSSVFGPDSAANSSRAVSLVNRKRSSSWVNNLLAKSDGEQHPRQPAFERK